MALGLTQQPVSVCIDAHKKIFQHYSSGIIKDGCGSSLDHCVLAVGYEEDAWIIKNSWGTSWGENGYARISKNDEIGAGICGILKVPAFPSIDWINK